MSDKEGRIFPRDIKEKINIRLLNNVGIINYIMKVVTKDFEQGNDITFKLSS